MSLKLYLAGISLVSSMAAGMANQRGMVYLLWLPGKTVAVPKNTRDSRAINIAHFAEWCRIKNLSMSVVLENLSYEMYHEYFAWLQANYPSATQGRRKIMDQRMAVRAKDDCHRPATGGWGY